MVLTLRTAAYGLVAPRSSSASANDLPIPRLAPVTRTVLSPCGLPVSRRVGRRLRADCWLAHIGSRDRGVGGEQDGGSDCSGEGDAGGDDAARAEATEERV